MFRKLWRWDFANFHIHYSLLEQKTLREFGASSYNFILMFFFVNILLKLSKDNYGCGAGDGLLAMFELLLSLHM